MARSSKNPSVTRCCGRAALCGTRRPVMSGSAKMARPISGAMNPRESGAEATTTPGLVPTAETRGASSPSLASTSAKRRALGSPAPRQTTLSPSPSSVVIMAANRSGSPVSCSKPRVTSCGVVGESGTEGSERTGAVEVARSRSKGTCSPIWVASMDVSPSDQVVISASISACSSSRSSTARSRIRRGSTSTTDEPAGRSSVRTESSGTTRPSQPSIPSKVASSAKRPMADDAQGAFDATRRACSAISGVTRSSRQAKNHASSTCSRDRWSAMSKVVSRSTSSPNRSMRTGMAAVGEKMSTIPPRTATSPRCSTWGSRR